MARLFLFLFLGWGFVGVGMGMGRGTGMGMGVMVSFLVVVVGRMSDIVRGDGSRVMVGSWRGGRNKREFLFGLRLDKVGRWSVGVAVVTGRRTDFWALLLHGLGVGCQYFKGFRVLLDGWQRGLN